MAAVLCLFRGSPVTAVVAVQASYQVDVTQLVQPEVVNGRGEAWEVVALERSVAESDGGTQSGQDPPVGDALLATQLTTQVENIILLAFTPPTRLLVYGWQVFITGLFIRVLLLSPGPLLLVQSSLPASSWQT